MKRSVRWAFRPWWHKSCRNMAHAPAPTGTRFFRSRGGRTFSGKANDGIVAVASELSMPIQRQALHVMGFDESHTSIRKSQEVAAQLNAILARVSAAKP